MNPKMDEPQRIQKHGIWFWLALVLSIGCPMVWLGWQYHVGREIRIGFGHAFFLIDKECNLPKWLKAQLGYDRPRPFEGLRPFEFVTRVGLSGQNGPPDESLRWLRWQPKLTRLWYHGPKGQTGQTCRLIGECCPSLETLGLSHVRLNDVDCRHLSKLKFLKDLTLRDVEVAEDGFEFLHRLPKLRAFSYRPNPMHLSNASLLAISRMDTVESAVFCITDSNLQSLLATNQEARKPLPLLKHLTLQGSNITGSTFEKLSSLSNLTHLTLSETKVNDNGLRQLESLTNLRQLYLAHCPITDEGCKSLAKLSKLESLHLGATQVTIEGVRHLTGLAHLRQLTIKECYKIRDPSEINSLPKSFLSRCRVIR